MNIIIIMVNHCCYLKVLYYCYLFIMRHIGIYKEPIDEQSIGYSYVDKTSIFFLDLV